MNRQELTNRARSAVRLYTLELLTATSRDDKVACEDKFVTWMATNVQNTQRDCFALEAMKGLCLKEGYANHEWPHNISVDAYAMADAMLKARDS